jgi:hypothetical protein
MTCSSSSSNGNYNGLGGGREGGRGLPISPLILTFFLNESFFFLEVIFTLISVKFWTQSSSIFI